MFAPVALVGKAKTSLSLHREKDRWHHFSLRPRKTILRKATFAVFKWLQLLLRAVGYGEAATLL
jgi:hypothetical protein